LGSFICFPERVSVYDLGLECIVTQLFSRNTFECD
jgi:hypothetical protein